MPRPEKAELSLHPHKIANLFFNFFGTILGLVFWLLSGSDLYHFSICIFGGASVDTLRHFFAPELRLTPAQRRESFLQAVANEDFAKANSRKFIFGTMWIYFIWILYVVAFIAIKEVRAPSNLTNIVIAKWLVATCADFYPVTRIYLHPLDYRTMPAAPFATLQFLTASWWIMIIGATLEITGGAFYRTHVLFRKFSIDKVAGKKVYAKDRTRTWLGILLFIPLYLGPAYFELLDALPPRIGSYSGYSFLYTLIISGLMIICCAFLIRGVYAVVLARCSGVIDLVGNMDKLQLDQIYKSEQEKSS